MEATVKVLPLSTKVTSCSKSDVIAVYVILILYVDCGNGEKFYRTETSGLALFWLLLS